jgi:hypothetical protein
MRICLLAVLLVYAASSSNAQQSYAGFDRNEYPGDAALPALRESFSYTGYWLNNPPGASRNTWMGKRALLRQHGFGFLVLFNGRTSAQLKGKDAAALGVVDGKAAVAAATREGFNSNVLIFLDLEEGGRLTPQQADYLFSWADTVESAGLRAGVYCSSIEVPEDNGKISTAQDIAQRDIARRKHAQHDADKAGIPGQRIALWIANDQCPPAPGCTLSTPRLSAALSPGISASTVAWQYAQTPRRAQFSAACPKNQASNGNCYAPGVSPSSNIFVDLDTADSPDPSEAPQ